MLTKIKTECEACSVSTNGKPTPLVSPPIATRHNHVVTLDLKEHGDKYIWYAVDMFRFIMNKEAKSIAKSLLNKLWLCLVPWAHYTVREAFQYESD